LPLQVNMTRFTLKSTAKDLTRLTIDCRAI
jgi:hypothetical protein